MSERGAPLAEGLRELDADEATGSSANRNVSDPVLTGPLLAAITAFVVSLAACSAAFVLGHGSFNDLNVYVAEGNALRTGKDIYGPLVGTPSVGTYPPFAVALFTVLTYLPRTILQVSWYVASTALVVVCTHEAFRNSGMTRVLTRPLFWISAAAFLWCEPVYTTLQYGQINMLLLALVLCDFTLLRNSRWHGVGVGIAAAVKVTPLIFVVYLLVTRRTRAGLVSLATVAATIVLSVLINPAQTRNYWTTYLFDIHRVGRLENAVNQTIRGMLVRIDHTREVPNV